MKLDVRKAKVFITVKTYPQPSKKYEELVCTAGLLNGEKWIRIYPVSYRFLQDESQYPKYAWIELDLERRTEDFRPESYRPKKGIQEDIKVIDHISTEKNDGWRRRKEIVLENVYSSMEKLIAESRKPTFRSLGTIKPREIIDVQCEEEKSREWDYDKTDKSEELDLFEPSKWRRTQPSNELSECRLSWITNE